MSPHPQALFDAAPQAYLVFDRSMRVVAANRAYLASTHRALDELMGRDVGEVCLGDAETLALVRASLERVLRDGQPETLPLRRYDVILPAGRGGGLEPRHWCIQHAPVLDAQGVVEAVLQHPIDASERDARLRLVVENALDHAILATDGAGVITEWSGGAQLIFGWEAVEAIGRHVSLIFTPEDRMAGIDAMELVTAALHGSAPDKRWHLCKDGRRVFMNGSLNMLPTGPSGEPHGFLKIARDETDRHRAEEAVRELNDTLERRVLERSEALQSAQEQLRQSQKMEAMGQLTGGIAHDFNNLLATITASLELMNRRVASGRTGDLPRYLTMASTAAQSAAALVQRLLTFSRKQSLDLQATEVNRLIADMEDMLRRSVGESIRFELHLQPGLPRVNSDRNQLENALLNLTINARDAMPEGGLLRVATCSRELDAGYAAMHPDVAPGQYVMVSVSDNGSGMAPEVVAQAFDPFFTTKPIGRGTGLGLSMTYGFARQTGGHASIHSIPGEGTTVNIYLPCNLAPLQQPVTREQSVARSPQGRGETVLFVEDESGVRRVLSEILGDLGYVTHEAVDAASALALEERLEGIDLLITDVGLPGVNGRDLAELMRERRPALKVLFITGYASKAAVRGEFLASGMDMLAKPFTIDALAHKVREMLVQV